MNSWFLGIAALGGIAGFFALAGWVLPAYIVGELRMVLKKIKESGWLDSHPKRSAMYLSFLEWVEYELPEPDEFYGFYTNLGDQIALYLGKRVPIFLSSGPKWKKLLREIGDEVDANLDTEILAMGGHPERKK